MEPQIISVMCPKCGRTWDCVYDERDGPPPMEIKCSICVYNEVKDTNKNSDPTKLDMYPGDF